MAPPAAIELESVRQYLKANRVEAGLLRASRGLGVELGPAAPEPGPERRRLFAKAGSAVLAAGGRPAASASKLARTLGY